MSSVKINGCLIKLENDAPKGRPRGGRISLPNHTNFSMLSRSNKRILAFHSAAAAEIYDELASKSSKSHWPVVSLGILQAKLLIVHR